MTGFFFITMYYIITIHTFDMLLQQNSEEGYYVEEQCSKKNFYSNYMYMYDYYPTANSNRSGC